MIDVNDACRLAITQDGWDEATSEDAIREDFERLAHSAKTTGSLDLSAALTQWRAERTRRYPASVDADAEPAVGPQAAGAASV